MPLFWADVLERPSTASSLHGVRTGRIYGADADAPSAPTGGFDVFTKPVRFSLSLGVAEFGKITVFQDGFETPLRDSGQASFLTVP